MRLGPGSDCFKVAASMRRIEIDKRRRVALVLGLPPYLTEDTNIRVAHQHLPQDVEAVRRVHLHNVLAVHKCALLLRLIVVVIPMESFAQEILQQVRSQSSLLVVGVLYQTMQMM